MDKNLEVIKNLIDAMGKYAMENDWLDNEWIEALVDCGITKQDFIDCDYGDCDSVIEYFEE